MLHGWHGGYRDQFRHRMPMHHLLCLISGCSSAFTVSIEKLVTNSPDAGSVQVSQMLAIPNGVAAKGRGNWACWPRFQRARCRCGGQIHIQVFFHPRVLARGCKVGAHASKDKSK